MNIKIGELELYVDFDKVFNEKVSVLKKNKSCSIKSSIYIEEGKVPTQLLNSATGNDKINLLKNMKSIPDTIFVTKGGKYFWVFEGCNLISLSIEKDKEYRGYQNFSQEKWVAKIEFSYEDVFGTNKPDVVKREIVLNNLLSRD